MHVGRFTAAVLLLASLAASSGCGTPAATGQTPEWSKERAEFEDVLARWRPFLAELRQLREDYATGEPDQQEELSTRYDEMVKQGQVIEGDLIDTAVAACVKHPDENEDLAGFLATIVQFQLMREEYEDAWKMAQVLIDNKIGDWPDDSSLYYTMCYCAAIAAYAANEFDVADGYLKFLEEKQIRLAGRRNPMVEVVDECRANMAYHKKAWEREQELREQDKLADLPRVLLKTSKGDIELELFENEAPNTVANFVSLVEKDFYRKASDFFRVKPRNMAQAGCPKNNGTGGPDYTIRCECYQPNHRLHFRGSVAMALSGRDTGGSQFYITYRPARDLDGQHTVFGRVVRGIEVLSRLQPREPPDPINEQFVKVPKADKILEARVLRKRNHPYKPKVIPKEEPDSLLEGVGAEYRPF